MGTQVGNATPIEVETAALDERVEDSSIISSDSFVESSWREESSADF
ncbi:MAG TPA: hypothetical protein VE954_33520 [Oligoflexus sp.]|nr:hypothetical protein [Oligoflexus sp.]HYX38048.1 hypothetical protein [Oligoflexus sp.]